MANASPSFLRSVPACISFGMSFFLTCDSVFLQGIRQSARSLSLMVSLPRSALDFFFASEVTVDVLSIFIKCCGILPPFTRGSSSHTNGPRLSLLFPRFDLFHCSRLEVSLEFFLPFYKCFCVRKRYREWDLIPVCDGALIPPFSPLRTSVFPPPFPPWIVCSTLSRFLLGLFPCNRGRWLRTVCRQNTPDPQPFLLSFFPLVLCFFFLRFVLFVCTYILPCAVPLLGLRVPDETASSGPLIFLTPFMSLGKRLALATFPLLFFRPPFPVRTSPVSLQSSVPVDLAPGVPYPFFIQFPGSVAPAVDFMPGVFRSPRCHHGYSQCMQPSLAS